MVTALWLGVSQYGVLQIREDIEKPWRFTKKVLILWLPSLNRA